MKVNSDDRQRTMTVEVEIRNDNKVKNYSNNIRKFYNFLYVFN